MTQIFNILPKYNSIQIALAIYLICKLKIIGCVPSNHNGRWTVLFPIKSVKSWLNCSTHLKFRRNDHVVALRLSWSRSDVSVGNEVFHIRSFNLWRLKWEAWVPNRSPQIPISGHVKTIVCARCRNKPKSVLPGRLIIRFWGAFDVLNYYFPPIFIIWEKNHAFNAWFFQRLLAKSKCPNPNVRTILNFNFFQN